jgi:hypothetical protein
MHVKTVPLAAMGSAELGKSRCPGVARSRLLQRLGTLAPETIREIASALVLVLGIRDYERT